MSIICAHKGKNGTGPVRDFSPTPAMHKTEALVDRIGGTDCFEHVCTFLSKSEQINLIVTRKDRTVWRNGISHLNFSGRNVEFSKIQELLATMPNVKKLTLTVNNPAFLRFHLVPANHPSLQSLALKVVGSTFCTLAAANETVLTHLDLSESNIILVRDPTGFARFSRLEQLILNDCKVMFSEQILGQIGHLSSLRDLRLKFSQLENFTDNAFSCLSALTRLETLTLSACDIAEIGFAALAKLPCLKTLDCHNCELVTDAALRFLSNNSSLQVLKLRGRSQSTHPDLASLARLRQLETLELPNYRETTDAEVQELEKLSLLTSLTLNGAQITSTGYASIAQHPYLKKLDLSRSRITDNGLEVLSQISSLESLNLFDCSEITDAGLAHLVNLPQLRDLDVGFCTNITWAAIDTFANYRQALGLPAVRIRRK